MRASMRSEHHDDKHAEPQPRRQTRWPRSQIPHPATRLNKTLPRSQPPTRRTTQRGPATRESSESSGSSSSSHKTTRVLSQNNHHQHQHGKQRRPFRSRHHVAFPTSLTLHRLQCPKRRENKAACSLTATYQSQSRDRHHPARALPPAFPAGTVPSRSRALYHCERYRTRPTLSQQSRWGWERHAPWLLTGGEV